MDLKTEVQYAHYWADQSLLLPSARGSPTEPNSGGQLDFKSEGASSSLFPACKDRPRGKSRRDEGDAAVLAHTQWPGRAGLQRLLQGPRSALAHRASPFPRTPSLFTLFLSPAFTVFFCYPNQHSIKLKQPRTYLKISSGNPKEAKSLTRVAGAGVRTGRKRSHRTLHWRRGQPEMGG